MTLFSLIVALLIEHLRPISTERFVEAPLKAFAHFLEDRFNDGEARHGAVAWWVAMLSVGFVSALAYFVLWHVHPLLAMVFNVVILYFTMAFRNLSRFFSDLQLALRMGELARARQLIGVWRKRSHDASSSTEVARLAIEEALIAAHRNVFAVIFWFILLPGPSGALLYRLARFFDEEWSLRKGEPEFGDFGEFAHRAFAALDWLPVRLSAAAFSIVGDFEDAVYCWRAQAAQWADKASGILLASGGGALGVRLGMPVHESGEIVERPEMGIGDEADADFMQSTIGLIWRTLVLVFLVLALLGVAGWVGH
ncbi:MAG TPA: CobD/CbiB family protein [Rhodocyclaceae bacterium]|uniref:CobD/CbiB family protein n=1 Tax=Zoogloea sp. TaxID=49181 RepID=UPI002C61F9DA|nr:CobD/CbiB family protein [Zoogloea sp.]HMV18486.1 CobD/CbiB family protein [Rhodocyclaceae bacterium]HMV64491.1 CobD/CbiB family protein [Rhodocyclaceae bacterium]HMY48173.1 CobD/CbiB family protein [Rhodocyclaceae bacterium]HMZ74805.1 CobD/CbiB family protein [Rhodocyclaceae bacterium]HNA68624.1 CobD/CbiB family protein [Rhodocyclaceae bacterium]